MINKSKDFLFLRIYNQTQQGNTDARDGIDKSVATMCNKGDITYEQVFYILFFDAVFMSNKSSFSF